MSLVSCFTANVEWNLRASESEKRLSDIGEKIKELTDRISGIQSEITEVDDSSREAALFNYNKGYLQFLNGITSDEDAKNKGFASKEVVNEQINKVVATMQQIQKDILSTKPARKAYLKQYENTLHKEEQDLQAEKSSLEVEYKMAQQFGEQFKKMQDNAIKRFAINV